MEIQRDIDKIEEKAKEILKCKKCGFKNKMECNECFDKKVILDMAEWKEQQMIKKAVNFLNENLMRTLLFDKYDKETFITNFKKAKEGGEE